MNNKWSILIACAALATGSVTPATAQDEAAHDLRDISVGMAVADLPDTGYTNLACRSATERTLKHWSEYAQCPADEAGRHELHFEYAVTDPVLASLNDRWEGTKVAGHPVLLSLVIDNDGTVDAIRIVTDPSARMYLRKKAFLLGLRVRGQYGEEGWTCVEEEKASGESPIGGMFVKQRCDKQTGERAVHLETDLFRGAGQSGKDFQSATRLEIRLADS